MTVRLLAGFNLLAGTASIAGFLWTVSREDWSRSESWFYGGLFLTCATAIAYVLFVPGTRVEQNVRAKIEHFTSSSDGSAVSVQRGTVKANGVHPVSAEFAVPFEGVPKVFVIGSNYASVKIGEITPLHVVFEPHGAAMGSIHWVARGTLLKRTFEERPPN